MAKGDVECCYYPIFQSGGKYDLKPSAECNDEKLHVVPDSKTTAVIYASLGVRYKSYCSNSARTFFFNATSTQKAQYAVVVEAFEAAVAALRPGALVSDAHKAVLALVTSRNDSLVPHLFANFGFSVATLFILGLTQQMGFEFRESLFVINDKCSAVVKPGMIFNVTVGLQNLVNKETKSELSKT